MNGRGGCCIARHAGGGGGMYGMSKVERIMLKYRPIAPKPVAAGSGSGGSTTENSDGGYVKCGRGKRKYVRVNKNNKKKDDSKRCSGDEKRKMSASSSSPPPPSSEQESVSRGGDAVVTLSLLPETPDRKGNSPVSDFPDLLSADPTTKAWNCNCNNKKKSTTPVWLSFNNQEEKVRYGHVGRVDPDPVVIKPPSPPLPPRLQVVSQVTVECVTDTWVGVEGLGCTDEERVKNMERDTCPGFISDGQDRVVWANKAYRQMAGVGQMIGGEDMSVVLVRKDKWMAAPVTYPAFTCKVKVCSAVHSQHTSSPSPPSPTLTLPCDVWRMKRGACAWRLDVKAALSLGR
ncbi:uncharacterized protein LOC112510470 [Cynara cardunculus var. scolymus]|uniref:uncharacterized protein LOC112510470 n=1 Tax=Cynara cardunculus var. scolymus TaxID=59895 RepID=UPI000D62B44E|nr:uncharacterized protein LOC112510470 [Cynara cardunculus var. scolymus]